MRRATSSHFAVVGKLQIYGKYSSRDGKAMVIKSLRYCREEKIARLSCFAAIVAESSMF